jgi:hypothetical protein
MRLSNPTIELLTTLDAFSNHKLTRRNDLGILIELATMSNRRETLEEVCFLAKFVSKAYGMLQRLRKDEKGYETLMQEFTTSVKKTRALIDALLSGSSAETKLAFSSTYLGLNPESLQHLLALCYDLSWYKNWLIDRAG